MKKINAIAWLITMLMTFVTSPAYATDWGSENVKMKVGETKTLYLPNSVTSKPLKGNPLFDDYCCYQYIEVLSSSDSWIKVKAVKPTTTGIILRCDYRYFINYGGFMYENGGTYDFIITVEGETPIKPTKITIPSSVSVEVGVSEDIVAVVTPSNAVYTLMWDISDSSIATVYQNGMLTGKSVGSAILKVKADNGVYATCKVIVTPSAPSNIDMKSSLSMTIDETYTLSPVIYPTNALYTLSWSTDNSSVATVSQSGVVTAKSAGTANITVKTDNGKTATCAVTVTAKSVTGVSISPSLSLEVGSTYILTPAITPSDAVTSCTWSTDNSSVATVSQSGVVTAKSVGTANITVKTDNGKTAICKVTVKTIVATEHEVRFSIYGYEYGQVLYNGKKLTGDVLSNFGSFKVSEGNDVALTILPNEGCEIYWLWVDYEDVENWLANNELTLRDVRKDTYIVVAFSGSDASVGIDSVYNDNREPASGNNKTIIYNLQGQRVDPSQARNGIFIVNGKKVHIK